MKLRPVVTCEHAGNTVPLNYAHLFHGKEDILQSHRGWDPGAVEVASALSKELLAPFFICETTRLLVEPNRSLHSESLFSEYSQGLTDAEKDHLLQNYYHPHRTTVEELIRNSKDTVLHLSIHTFTPAWDGLERAVDLGLLFDPERKNETKFCEDCRTKLKKSLPAINIEFNEPYKGIDDGFTTYLRTQFGDDKYLGIEIEINQKFVGTDNLKAITGALSESLRSFCGPC
jgi:predicted N-formylglutamate amidohydrolase